MTRPLPVGISSALEAWDAEVQKDFDLVFTAPVPLYEHDDTLADLTTNFPPGNYDRCVCLVNDTTAGWVLVMSDGTNWIILGKSAVDPSDLGGTSGGTGTVVVTVTKPTALGAISVTDPADSPATADALRDDLVTNAIAEIRTHLTDHKTALDTIEGTSIDEMRDSIEGIQAKINGILAAMRTAGMM
ncbi:MAG: hypothetical protein GY906_13045 [bacterium]|nr:hypothetical protein [bacterium]